MIKFTLQANPAKNTKPVLPSARSEFSVAKNPCKPVPTEGVPVPKVLVPTEGVSVLIRGYF